MALNPRKSSVVMRKTSRASHSYDRDNNNTLLIEFGDNDFSLSNSPRDSGSLNHQDISVVPLTPVSPEPLYSDPYASPHTTPFSAAPPSPFSASQSMYNSSTPVRPPRPPTTYIPQSHYPLTPPSLSSSSSNDPPMSLPVASPRKSKIQNKKDITKIGYTYFKESTLFLF